VNRWAFVAEKVLHGNPSGVDNSVAVFGGALAYTRAGFGKKSGMESIQGFKSLRFLLTDSKVPRDTKKLVAGVGERKRQDPELINGLLDSIQSISDEARRCLADPELSREQLLSAISALIEENHAHLATMGVSHVSLEAIKAKTKSSPYGLSTKLTGAGGGGCAVTLVPDDFKETVLQDLIVALSNDKFDTYLTSVGGSGLGILSPYGQRLQPESGPVTPPETPNGNAKPVDAGDGAPPEPMRAVFETNAVGDLAGWAEGLGRWLYV